MMYRLLPAEEFDRLEPFCERNGIPMPNPATSHVAVAEQDGEIRYVHMLHMQLHLDNCVRDRDFRGYFDFRKVYAYLEAALPNQAITLYTYPSFAAGVRAAEILGFERAEYPLMMKKVPAKELICL